MSEAQTPYLLQDNFCRWRHFAMVSLLLISPCMQIFKILTLKEILKKIVYYSRYKIWKTCLYNISLPVGLNKCTMYKLYICCTYIIKTIKRQLLAMEPAHTVRKTRGRKAELRFWWWKKGEERGSRKMESPGPGKEQQQALTKVEPSTCPPVRAAAYHSIQHQVKYPTVRTG